MIDFLFYFISFRRRKYLDWHRRPYRNLGRSSQQIPPLTMSQVLHLSSGHRCLTRTLAGTQSLNMKIQNYDTNVFAQLRECCPSLYIHDVTVFFRPEVLPAKSTETRGKSAIDFRLYDAVLASQRLMAKDQASAELDNFLPLLNDYLKSQFVSSSLR